MKNNFSGMTVNERLYHSNLLNIFDELVKLKDFENLRLILKKIELDESSIENIIENLKQNKK